MRNLILPPFLAFSIIVNAQDTHYQFNQFGTRSALLGGAVAGGVKDNTALFYNPGSFGFIDTASVSINANVYRYENINIQNAIGREKDFKNSNFVSVPMLIAGLLPSKNQKLKWGYGLSSPVDFSFFGSGRVDTRYPIVDDSESPGTEAFIGQTQVETKVRETMGGIGLGYRLSEHWSIGLTNQFVLRNQDYTEVTLARFTLNQPGNPLISSNIWKSFKYTDVRYSAKIGLAYSGDRWDAGLTFNTPTVHLFGNGDVSADVTANDILVNGSRIDVLASDQQLKLKTHYKSPFKVGGGINFRSGPKTLLAVSAEYCGSVEIYDIMRAAPAAFVRPPELYESLGSDEFLRVKGGAKPVFNMALGYEHTLNEMVSIMAGLRTDNSWFDTTIVDTRGIKPDISSWDIYHFTGGASFKKGRSTLSIGLLFSAGADNEYKQRGNLSSPDEGNFLQGQTTITKARYNSFGILLGFSFNFKKF